MSSSVDEELEKAISNNQRLKSRILGFVFLSLLVFQLVVLLIFLNTQNIFEKFLGDRVAFVAPLFLVSMAAIEFYMSRRVARQTYQHKKNSKWLQYTGVFLEVRFPTFVMLFVTQFVFTMSELPADIRFLLNSPPFLLYFIFIILSALQLDFKLCLFAGTIAAVEYIFLSTYLTEKYSEASGLDYLINFGKAFFFILSGLISGIVAGKIRESVLSSLKAKNELIHHLDKKVKEKTREIERQNLLLVEKNKDITDSIIYARRIQNSLLPSEKYIDKQINRMK